MSSPRLWPRHAALSSTTISLSESVIIITVPQDGSSVIEVATPSLRIDEDTTTESPTPYQGLELSSNVSI